MKQLLKLFTFFIVVLAITLLNVRVEELKPRTHSLTNVEYSFEHVADQSTPIDSEDESVDIEFHQTEYLIHEQPFILSPETLTALIQGNETVFLSTYIFSIHIPPSTRTLA